MRLLRRLGANARYFTDQSTKIPLDVASGDAAVGMCIDYYGRFQAEAAAAAGRPGRVGFVTARGETSINPDPIALLRGAPHRELAIAFIEFVLSDEGQKLWSFRRGVPGRARSGTRCAGCRSSRACTTTRSTRIAPIPTSNPYEEARDFVYHRAWTGPLYGALAFVVRVMCVDPERGARRRRTRPSIARRIPARGDGAVRRRLGGRLREGRRGRCGPRCSRRIRWTRRAGRSGS